MGNPSIQHSIPLVSVQPDFAVDLNDVASRKSESSSFWISIYNNNNINDSNNKDVGKLSSSNSIHGKVHVYPQSGGSSTSSNNTRPLTLIGEPEELRDAFNYIDNVSFQINLSNNNNRPQPTTILSSQLTFQLSSTPSTLVTSPGGELILVGSTNGNLFILDAKDGSVVRDLSNNHHADVTVAKFFPSGQVVLTGSQDMQIKVMSAVDGSCPVTFKGHTSSILDLAIIGRGKNILSSSKDGTIRLWEPASGSCIRTIADIHNTPVNKLCLATNTLPSTNDRDFDSREVETEGKLLLAALEDGTCRGYDLTSKSEIFTIRTPSPLTTLDYNASKNLLITGSRNGLINMFDIRNSRTPLISFRRNDSPVLHTHLMTASTTPGSIDTVIATADGQCYHLSFPSSTSGSDSQSDLSTLDASEIHLVSEFVGYDLDAIVGCHVREKSMGKITVWTTGGHQKESVVKKFVEF